MINLAVSGCKGRMGHRITTLALEDPDFKISALLENPDCPDIDEPIEGISVSSDPNTVKGSNVLIEFTTPDATIKNLNACVAHKVKMVIGTTGLSDDQISEIKKASEKTAIVFSSNMSVGVNILFCLAKEAAGKTKDAYHAKITEAHHIHKKDKPSGTALTLAEAVEEGSGKAVKDIESLREGEIIGDHEVIFASDEDIITIKHHAKSRDIFAKGALVAAKWLISKNKGLYHMKDVLGLNI